MLHILHRISQPIFVDCLWFSLRINVQPSVIAFWTGRLFSKIVQIQAKLSVFKAPACGMNREGNSCVREFWRMFTVTRPQLCSIHKILFYFLLLGQPHVSSNCMWCRHRFSVNQTSIAFRNIFATSWSIHELHSFNKEMKC